MTARTGNQETGQKGRAETKKPCLSNLLISKAFRYMAEREGFEPSVDLRLRLISSQVHSTTLPPLRRAQKITGLRVQLKRKARKNPVATTASVKLHTNTVTYFLISLNHTTQALTETVLVQLLAGVLVPQTAAIGRELVTQHNLAMEQAKL